MQGSREDLHSRSLFSSDAASRLIDFSAGVCVDHRLYIDSGPSPFKKMPTEIMNEIFLFACGAGVLTPGQRAPEPLRRTLQLVCKGWQQIVVGSQALWNDLELKMIEHGSHNFGEVSLAVVDTLLYRARSWLCYAMPSPVSLHLLIAWCDEVVEVRRRIFSFLSAFKFRHLAVISLFPPILDLDASLDVSLSLVETLSLMTPTWLFPPIQQFSSRLQFSALKSLELAVHIDYTYKRLVSAFPWHQLDRLLLGTVRRPDTVATILNRCKSLVDCTIFIVQDDTSFVLLRDRIVLPQLRHLTIISDIVGPVTDAILRFIVTPNLESLCIWGECGSSPLTLCEVEAMARRSGCGDKLQTLALRNLYKAVDLGRLLRLIPSLNTAEVSGAISDKDMLHVADGSLGPRLEHISLAGYDLKLDKLLDMVEQRQMNAGQEGSMISSLVTASFISHICTDEHYERAAYLEDEFNFKIVFDPYEEEGEEVDDVTEEISLGIITY